MLLHYFKDRGLYFLILFFFMQGDDDGNKALSLNNKGEKIQQHLHSNFLHF